MPADAVADEDLLRRFLEHDDEAAFTELMRRHEDRVFAMTLRITGDRSDALDATQDAFIAAFRRAGSFRGESAFGTWLGRIAINAARDVVRRRGRTPVATEDEASAADVRASLGTQAMDEQVTLRGEIAQALGQLSEDYRTAVALHDLAGVPYEEIARTTGVSIGTVKSRISRGRKRLGELLEHPSAPRASKERR